MNSESSTTEDRSTATKMVVEEAAMEGSAEGYQEFSEGKVRIGCSGAIKTFYNPVQEFNRDLTVSVLRQFVNDRDQHRTKLLSANGDDPKLEPATKKLKTKDHSQLDEKIRILDALSASGLRALRFAKEVRGVGSVVANDFSEEAVEAIKRHIKLNGVEDLVSSSFGDAVDVLMSHRSYDKRFHAVDLDPYGSASLFLDSAVQAVSDGGILMVTCTDTATLCGNTPEACYNKYGSIPIRHKSCHEFALRILLKTIDSHACRHGRYIKPLLSISIDFYIRCFVQLDSSPLKAKDCSTKLSNVFACSSCHSLDFQPLIKKTVNGASTRFTNASFRSSMVVSGSCDSDVLSETVDESNGQSADSGGCGAHCIHCGGKAIHMGGPIYSDPIHEETFVGRLIESIKSTPKEEQLGTHERLVGVLTMVSEEIHDVPLYYEHDQLMTVVKCSSPKHLFFRSAVINAGFKCSISHCNANALKTNAPVALLWDIARSWAHRNKVNPEKFPEGSPARTILSKKCTYKVDFTTNTLAIPRSRIDCLLRFQDNKGKNWGPRAKAKGSVNSSTVGFKRKVEADPSKSNGGVKRAMKDKES